MLGKIDVKCRGNAMFFAELKLIANAGADQPISLSFILLFFFPFRGIRVPLKGPLCFFRLAFPLIYSKPCAKKVYPVACNLYPGDRRLCWILKIFHFISVMPGSIRHPGFYLTVIIWIPDQVRDDDIADYVILKITTQPL